MPRVTLDMALTPILVKLAWQDPLLTVEVCANDAFVDIVAQCDPLGNLNVINTLN